MITKEEIEEMAAWLHSNSKGHTAGPYMMQKAAKALGSLIARVEELEAMRITEYRDDKTRDRYMELVAYACESFDVDVQRVELSTDPVAFICTAKSQVDEVNLAEAVGRVMSEALKIAHEEDTQQAKADAWDEGYGACLDDEHIADSDNPYRKNGES